MATDTPQACPTNCSAQRSTYKDLRYNFPYTLPFAGDRSWRECLSLRCETFKGNTHMLHWTQEQRMP
eukprot:1244359-Amphidinium_carterae.1